MTTASRPDVLIEHWLPLAEVGIECKRERSTGQQPPDKRLHVWGHGGPSSLAELQY